MLRSWLQSLGRRVKRAARPPGNASPDRHRARLSVEALEDRTVPMAVAVTNLNPAGAGSLAVAVAAVDASTDASNTITFAQGLMGSIPLNGELDLTDTSNQAPNKSITITGLGSAVLGVSGNGLQGNFRDFWIAKSA